jgi:DNA processing protein
VYIRAVRPVIMSTTAASQSNEALWLALALTPGLSAARVGPLVQHFGSVQAIFRASLTDLEAAGLRPASAQAIALGKSLESAQEEMLRAAAAGAQVLTLDDPLYSAPLRQIYDPPTVLFLRGNAELLQKPGIAVIGTRHPTPYGLGMAERLSCDLAARGLVIISGMARGIDSAAHRGAVTARGKTIAVFGTGVDIHYPRENARLAEQILSLGGALLSEFPMGTPPTPQNFPIRNRIISGLALGVLVVEAGEYSGTRVTARCALEQSRELFAVPGNVTNKLSWGPNTLIKQGAKLTATWEDVWEELPSGLRATLEGSSRESESPASASLFPDHQLPPHERKVLALIRADESTHIDTLVEKLENELSSSEIFAALFELELAGKVRQLPGKNYVKSF